MLKKPKRMTVYLRDTGQRIARVNGESAPSPPPPPPPRRDVPATRGRGRPKSDEADIGRALHIVNTEVQHAIRTRNRDAQPYVTAATKLHVSRERVRTLIRRAIKEKYAFINGKPGVRLGLELTEKGEALLARRAPTRRR
jgi:DNA-directed RNA polymerase specialized sigma24 family protein